jgi:rSAM/selenodomain-associated transferase 2
MSRTGVPLDGHPRQSILFETILPGDVTISIVIPVLNEQILINEAIECIRGLPLGKALEIIVVDGGNQAETVSAIRDEDVERLSSKRGRGAQMNRGAAVAHGEVLLFMHADTRLPSDGLRSIASSMDDARFSAGAFDLEIAGKGMAYRIIEKVASFRSRLTGIPYGDQAIFVRRDYFLGLGGYKELPIMEDVDLMRRIKRDGGKVCFVSGKARTSARRWEKEGVIRCTFRNWTIMLLYLLGVTPQRLVRWYPS